MPHLYAHLIMNIASYLKQPFPSAKNKWRNTIAISIFVTLFLFIFQPFGIVNIENGIQKNLFISGFGLVTFVLLVIDLILLSRLFPKFFEEKNWYLWKELIWLFFVVSSIGLGNVFYTSFFSEQVGSFSFIIGFQLITFAVAIFPISVFTISKHNYLLRKHTHSAQDVNEHLKADPSVNPNHKKISIFSYNQKAKVDFDLNELLYIESKRNDIEFCLQKEGTLSKETLRNTLKNSLEHFTNSSEIIQCHRAFIVNLNKIEKTEGNSQGLLLKLSNSELQIPVSRTYVSSVKDHLR